MSGSIRVTVLVLRADHPHAGSAGRDFRRGRTDGNLTDDGVRVGIDDSDRIGCDRGEPASRGAARQFDYGNGDRGSKKDGGADSDEEAALTARRLAP